MPVVQYPFIDIAVHERVREGFARGDAIVLFSADMARVLWANGAGARLFASRPIYDFIEEGPGRADVTFRQVETMALQLARRGDSRPLTIRVAQGFRRVGVPASVERIATPAGEDAVLFSVPAQAGPLPLDVRASRMLEGFDDDDTHMAVLGKGGAIVAASAGFAALGITDHTARALVTMVEHDADRLMKRPIPTGRGYLPAAIGRICDDPGLNLLFVVEMAIGNLDPTEDFAAPPAAAAPEPPSAVQAEPETPVHVAAELRGETETGTAETGFDTALDALARIEDVEEDADSFAAEMPQADAADEPAEDAPEEPNPGDDGDEDAMDQAAHAPPPPLAPAAISAMMGDLPQALLESDGERFQFNNSARAIRFVWKIDAEGRFSDVSGEFAKAVGPHAASVRGMAFTDIAHLFQLDPDGTIADLLGKRDTWSGKTIYWPVEGTGLRVPVDLAALPTYTRNREFDGFRGFGIVRPADVVPDPLELGLTLAADADALGGETGEAQGRDEDVATTPDTDTDAQDAPAATAEAPDDADLPAANETEPAGSDWPDVVPEETDEGLEDADAPPADDTPSPAEVQPFLRMPWGEIPALRITETPNRRQSDRIMQQQERRARGDMLTPGEQAAFREIARRLETLTQTDAAPSQGTPEAAVADAGQDMPPSFPDVAQDAAAAVGDETSSEVADDAPRQPDTETGENGPQTLHDALAPFIPVRAAMGGLTAADIDAMETAQLVHAGDRLIHANPAFLALTGYESLQDLDDVGGLDSLLLRDEIREDAGLTLLRADDELVRVTANLKSIRWGYGHALMLSLAPVLPGQPETADPAPEADETIEVDTTEFEPEDRDVIETGDMTETGEPTVEETTQEIEAEAGPETEAAAQDEPPAEDEAEPAGDEAAGAATPDEEEAELHADDGDGMADPASDEEDEGEAPAADTVASTHIADELVQKIALLRGEVEELRSILETATDGVVVLEPDHTIRSMNRSASALFNYDNAETRGKPFVMLFAHESQKSVMDYLGALASHGVASVLNDGREVIGREASGGFLPLFMTMGRLSASDGYCAVIRDITQWKRTEEELRNAKRAAETANAHKSDFLARVSHEIRTPLNAIIGFSDMMATERFGTIGHPRYIEYANDIGRSGRHVLDIVNDLLDISKIEAGEMDLDFTEVGLNETISEAVALVQPQANGQRVIIRTALSNAVPHVVADLRSIKQIALNILSNAIRFTPSGGQIVVSTIYEANGSVVLRIRDTGIGMTRSELEQAMKPFRQVTTGTRARGDGTGLGLPLTKAMVDANRAQFSISSAPNEGTLVEITFPAPRVLAE